MRSFCRCFPGRRPASGAALKWSVILQQSVFQREWRPARSARSATRSCRATNSCCPISGSSSSINRGPSAIFKRLEDGTVDLGLAQAGIAYMAYHGRLPEADRPLRNIRGVAVLNSSTVHLLVGPRSRARSINDLKGLRIGVGPAGTGNAVTSELLLSPYAADALRTLGVAAGQTADTVLAGELDAAFTISGIPHDEVGRATRDGARLVHVNGQAMDQLRSAYPFFRSAVIPAGTYPNQRESIQTLSIDIVLLTRKDLDDALVRQLTAALFQMLPRLTSELDFLKGMDPERAPATPIPLHRGATLYYRERELRR